MSEPVLLLTGRPPEEALVALEQAFAVHRLWEAPSPDEMLAKVGGEIEAVAVFGKRPVDAALLERFPKLKIVSNFGVGYDLVDARWAGEHGVVVTNTPDVLNEEVADTALGLLIATVREFGAAERHLREGKWAAEGPYRLTSSLRGRTIGIVGMGRIGRAIARRIEAFDLPVVYHSRRPQEGVAFRHYPDLVQMATDVDTLIVIVPGGATTKNMINAKVLQALGPEGVVVNVARGTVIDEPALIAALKDGTILGAGLDVFAQEPKVPAELIALENCVLLPHVGSASVATRRAMAQLVIDNLKAYADRKPPLTPVSETPFTGWRD